MTEPQEPPVDPKFEHVVAEYLRRVDGGGAVDIEELCQGDAALVVQLREFIAGEQLLRAAVGSPTETTQQSIDTSRSQSHLETLKPGSAGGADASLVGRMFGRYRVMGLLGSGAMGSVYLAEDPGLDRKVALKVPKLLHPGDEEYLHRFHREAKAIAGLSHPNICPVYDIGNEQGHPFIAMAYIEGEPLSQLLSQPEYSDQRSIVTIIATIAAALQHAHSAGTIHRDLKPGNVLIDKQGRPIVTDFGLARRVGQQDESRITQLGAILGTPAYMSKEQVEGDPTEMGPRSDIHSLGVMLYEMLAGKLPFVGSIAAILAQIHSVRPQSIRTHRPEISPELDDLCLQMLEKDPEHRPASMQIVADRLQQWLKEHSDEALHQQKLHQKGHEKLEHFKQQIEQLLRQGSYSRAIQGLEKLAQLQEPAAREYVVWAKEQLPRVQALPKQIRENLPVVLSSAQTLVRKHDYAQAAEMLQQVPVDLRPEPIRTLLEQAVELQEESDLLLLSLQECVKLRSYQGIEENLQRFLQLKPANRFAKELQSALGTYSKTPLKERKYQHDPKGRLLPQQVNSVWDNWLLWAAICLLFVGGVSYWGFTIYLKKGNVTLAVDVDPALLRDGDFELTVDGTSHQIRSPEFETLTVELGNREFSVKRGDLVIHSPKHFSIEKNGRTLLKITQTSIALVERPVPLASSTNSPAQTGDSGTGSNPGNPSLPDPSRTTVVADSAANNGGSSTLNPYFQFLPSASSDPFNGKQLKEEWRKSSLNNTFVWIPPGQFRMGTVESKPDESNEAPVDVTFTRGKWVAVTEVTQKQWKQVAGTTPWMAFQDKQVLDNAAATHMTWNEAVEYCQSLTTRDRRDGIIPPNWEYRLPSEAEWEYFCRAGTFQKYTFGNDVSRLKEYAWWRDNTEAAGQHCAQEVGLLKPNAWGLYDIHGNVYELCYDSFVGRLPGGIDPIVVDPPIAGKISRGGGWAYLGPEFHECSDRRHLGREERRNSMGLRLVLAEITPGSASNTATSQPVSTTVPGLKLASHMVLSGTYLQASPPANHKIEVRLQSQEGNIWKGEMESFEATTTATGEVTKTGLVFECEFEILGADTARLQMLRVAHNKSGIVVRDTTPAWIEQLKWNGRQFSNSQTTLVPPLAALNSKQLAAGSRTLTASDWDILPKGADRDWRRNGDTLVGQRGRDVSIAWTRSPYDDFQISVEFQCSKEANGGILLRSPAPHGGFHPALEVHLGDGKNNFLADGEFPFCGGVYLSNEGESGLDPDGKDNRHVDLVAEANAYKPGEWNQLTIRLVGSDLTVTLNNVIVQQRKLHELKLPYPHFGKILDRTSGYVGLQCFSGTVSYRKVSILPL